MHKQSHNLSYCDAFSIAFGYLSHCIVVMYEWMNAVQNNILSQYEKLIYFFLSRQYCITIIKA